MVWRRPGDKPLSEPKMARLAKHICITRPQWIKGLILKAVVYIQIHQSKTRPYIYIICLKKDCSATVQHCLTYKMKLLYLINLSLNVKHNEIVLRVLHNSWYTNDLSWCKLCQYWWQQLLDGCSRKMPQSEMTKLTLWHLYVSVGNDIGRVLKFYHY